MEHTIPEKENTLQCRNQLIALASVALAGAVFRCVYYYYYYIRYNYDYYLVYHDNVNISGWCFTILLILCAIVVPAAALLYFVKYQDKKVKDIAVLLIFITIAISGVVLVFSNIYRTDSLTLTMAVCALGCIGTFNGGEVKKYVIVLPIAGLVMSIFFAVICATGIVTSGFDFYTFAGVMGFIGVAAFYSSFLLFWLKNIVTPCKAKTVEQALAVLEDKRKLGIITEEEYQAERAKIIASL